MEQYFIGIQRAVGVKLQGDSMNLVLGTVSKILNCKHVVGEHISNLTWTTLAQFKNFTGSN